MKRENWQVYLWEFLSIFVGVTMAFALSKWNEDRKDAKAENKILIEIRNGLQYDLQDIDVNIYGHSVGISACRYFRKVIHEEVVDQDSFYTYNFALLRDYISIQNKSGYEALKSKGLDLVSDDSLRLEIITLYDYYYEVIEELEENYAAMQFYDNYYETYNRLIVSNIIFDEAGLPQKLQTPLELTPRDRQDFLHLLHRIERNRKEFMITFYKDVRGRVEHLIAEIEAKIDLESVEQTHGLQIERTD